MDSSASIWSTQPPSAGHHSALWALYTVPVAWFTVTIRRTSPSPTTITSVPRYSSSPPLLQASNISTTELFSASTDTGYGTV